MATDLTHIVVKIYNDSDMNEENISYMVIDTVNNYVVGHYNERSVAYEECYNFNFPKIIEYKVSQKENGDGVLCLELEEIDIDKNSSLSGNTNKEAIYESIIRWLENSDPKRKLGL